MTYTQKPSAEKRRRVCCPVYFIRLIIAGLLSIFRDGWLPGQISALVSHQDRVIQYSGLVKKSYSTFVYDGPGARPQKWHLAAYFTYADLQLLPTVDQDPLLGSITVPEGVYLTGRLNTSRADNEEEDDLGQGFSDHGPRLILNMAPGGISPTEVVYHNFR